MWIDVEQGTPLADVSADIAKLERTVAEKSAVGGNIALRSEGDLVLQGSATIDVSGGSIAYQPSLFTGFLLGLDFALGAGREVVIADDELEPIPGKRA